MRSAIEAGEGLGINMWKKAALVIVALVGLAWLAARIFAPGCVISTRETRERILQQDLFIVRQIISQYTLDNHKRPQSLDDLVGARYLKQMPTDPTTGRNDTWVLEWSDDPETPGIIGIHSGHR